MSRSIHFLPGTVMIHLMIGPLQKNEQEHSFPARKSNDSFNDWPMAN